MADLEGAGRGADIRFPMITADLDRSSSTVIRGATKAIKATHRAANSRAIERVDFIFFCRIGLLSAACIYGPRDVRQVDDHPADDHPADDHLLTP